MSAPVQAGPSPSGGGSVPSSGWEPALGAPLTDRDVDFLRRIAKGQTSQEIAQEWIYAESSVRKLSDRLRKKLGAKTNEQAVYLACQAGILDGRPRSQRHGDHTGYTNHQKRGEEACAACKAGERAYQVQRRMRRRKNAD